MPPIAIGLPVSMCDFVCACMCLSVCYTLWHWSPFSKNQKCKKNTFVDFDICHWMALLRKLFLVTLTYFWRSKIWNKTFLSDEQSFRYDFYEQRFKWRPSQGGERPFLYKVQMITKLFLQIWSELYGTHLRVALI